MIDGGPLFLLCLACYVLGLFSGYVAGRWR
jgi:hypothetical protein